MKWQSRTPGTMLIGAFVAQVAALTTPQALSGQEPLTSLIEEVRFQIEALEALPEDEPCGDAGAEARTLIDAAVLIAERGAYSDQEEFVLQHQLRVIDTRCPRPILGIGCEETAGVTKFCADDVVISTFTVSSTVDVAGHTAPPLVLAYSLMSEPAKSVFLSSIGPEWAATFEDWQRDYPLASAELERMRVEELVVPEFTWTAQEFLDLPTRPEFNVQSALLDGYIERLHQKIHPGGRICRAP